jgi:hypothetical protein
MVVQRIQHREQDAVDILRHIAVPEAQNPITAALEEDRPRGVGRGPKQNVRDGSEADIAVSVSCRIFA